MSSRVVIGMSGGVDSSVAAWRLREEGHEVIGVTMKLWPQECMSRAEDPCCGPQAITDARAVAQQIGIAHYVADEHVAFQRQVIDCFVAEYRAGRTPNPCILCNEKLKFGSLLAKSRSLGADYVATGHYAVVERGQRHLIRKGHDPRKDQSYYLYSLSQEQLAQTLFPLGDMTKEEVRVVAATLGLKVAAKQESQDICFVANDNYRPFLREQGVASHPGEIMDMTGCVLGRHDGIEFYTVGQRRGLGIATGRPMYVVALDPAHNRVIVGDDDDLGCTECIVNRCNWVGIASLSDPRPVTVKIRSQHSGAAAVIESLAHTRDGQVRVRFAQPERAVTPGQAAVFYDHDLLLGGGWIVSSGITYGLDSPSDACIGKNQAKGASE
jgi:tRNA-uridine 2-sulfurtransferase